MNKESAKAKKASILTYICNILGLVSGYAIVAVTLIILLRIRIETNSESETSVTIS